MEGSLYEAGISTPRDSNTHHVPVDGKTTTTTTLVLLIKGYQLFRNCICDATHNKYFSLGLTYINEVS